MAASSKYTAPKEDGTFVLKIPTKTDEIPNPAQGRKINLSQMDERDLESLHKSDPFMYYSIPGVLKACLNLEDVNYSDIASPSRSQGDSHPSSPSQPEDKKEKEKQLRMMQATYHEGPEFRSNVTQACLWKG